MKKLIIKLNRGALALWLLIAMLCSIVFSGQCKALSLEVVSPMKRVFLSTLVKEQKDNLKIELWAARNEFETVQIAMHSEKTVTINQIEATELVNIKTGEAISNKYFEYSFPQYVYLEKNTKDTPRSELDEIAPNWFPDPLVKTKSLKFEGVQSVWITWYIPSDKAPGEYRGELVINTDADTRQIPVVLHVWNFTLPARPSFYISNWLHITQIESQYRIKRGTEEYWRIIEKIAQDMISHRQNVIFTPLNLIKSIKLPDGSYDFDFNDYGKWVDIFIRNGFQVIEGSHLFHFGNSYDIRYQTKIPSKKVEFDKQQLETPEGKKYLASLLTALHRENVRLGIHEKYFQHVADEPKPEQLGLYKDIAKIVHQTMPGVPIIDAIELPPEKLEGMTDITVTLLGKPLSKTYSATGIRWGKWWYTCVVPRGKYPNRFIDYPLVKMRVIPWLSFCNGVNGYLHYGYNYWFAPSGKSPWEDVNQSGNYPPGDGFVVYPPILKKGGAPVSSLRWEVFRDGLEDYEYLLLLKQWKDQYEKNASAQSKPQSDYPALYNEAKNLLNEVSRSMSSPENYSRDPAFVSGVRYKIGSLLDKLVN